VHTILGLEVPILWKRPLRTFYNEKKKENKIKTDPSPVLWVFIIRRPSTIYNITLSVQGIQGLHGVNPDHYFRIIAYTQKKILIHCMVYAVYGHKCIQAKNPFFLQNNDFVIIYS